MSEETKESEARRRAFIAIDHICAWHGVGTSGKESWIEEVEKQIIAATAQKDQQIEQLKGEVKGWSDANKAQTPVHLRVVTELQESLQEIERLKSGGCARDQRTTQFCAEAVALQQEVDRLKAEVKGWSAANKAQTPVHIRVVTDLQEAQQRLAKMASTAEEQDQRIAELEQDHQHSELAHQQKNQRIAELEALLDESMKVIGLYINVPETLALREQWEKLKNS